MEPGSGNGRQAGAAERSARLLALVAELGSISEACRRMGVDRSVYYRLRRAAAGVLLGGPARKRNALPAEAEAAILSLCLEYPEWGCDRLAHYLTLTWRSVSSPTVQKILIRHGLGRVAQRVAERDRRRGA